MYSHKSWATFGAIVAVALFFIFIYLNMRHVADFEQETFQSDFTAIELQISGQITKGYEKGTEVVANINRLSLDSTEEISFALIDQMVKELPDQDAMAYISAYMSGGANAFALLEQDDFKPILKSGSTLVIPSKEVLTEWVGSLGVGEAISKDAYLLEIADGIERPRLHLFKMPSKPWILYVQVNESSRLKDAEQTASAIKDRFSLLNSSSTSDLVYVDARRTIIKSSKPDLVGQKLEVGQRVTLSTDPETIFNIDQQQRVKEVQSNFTWIQLTDSNGKVSKYIGKYVGEGAESKYFISESTVFAKEYVGIGKHLGIGVVINIFIAIAVIHLVASNYEYFVEGRRKEGGV